MNAYQSYVMVATIAYSLYTLLGKVHDDMQSKLNNYT